MGRAFVWIKYNGLLWPSLWHDNARRAFVGKGSAGGAVLGELVAIHPLPDEHASLALDDLAKLYPKPEASPNVPIKIRISDP